MPSGIKRALRRLSSRLCDLERRMGIRPQLELKTLLTGSEFERELLRQQSYAKRAGARFFLLRFFLAPSFPSAYDREEAMELLADAVRARMRLSDVAGRYAAPEDSVGLILRGARPEGVAGVVCAVSDSFDSRMRRLLSADAPAPLLSSEILSCPNEDGASSLRIEDEMSECPTEELF